MTLTDHGRIKLGNLESELLVQRVPNELIHGFSVPNFEELLGSSRENFKHMYNSLQSASKAGEITVDCQQAKILRNALAVVLHELGDDEFQTRTGIDFSVGQETLRNLDNLLSVTTQ